MSKNSLSILIILIACLPIQASAIHHSEGCTGPFTVPTPTSRGLCDIYPPLCDDTERLPPVVLGDGLIDMGNTTFAIEAGKLDARTGARRLTRQARTTLDGLEVRREIARTTLTEFTQQTRRLSQRLATGNLSAGVVMTRLGNLLIDAAEEGSETYAEHAAEGGTVTTTTSGGFEINLGIFKIFENQTVTTVEPLPGSGDDSGYTEECDDDGNCVCVEA